MIYNLSDTQKAKLEARKDYRILATHSFADDGVFYPLSADTYTYYYHNYTYMFQIKRTKKLNYSF